MMNGDGVGLLSLATSSPGSDYTDLGFFHQNTIMNWSSYDTGLGGADVVATNNLYIRTTDSSYDEASAKSAALNGKPFTWRTPTGLLTPDTER